MIKRFCDRCERQLNIKKFSFTFDRTDKELDIPINFDGELCKDCSLDLMDWVKTGHIQLSRRPKFQKCKG